MANYDGNEFDEEQSNSKRRKVEEFPGLEKEQLDFIQFCGGVPGTMTNFENFVFGQIPTCDDVFMQEPQPGLKPEDIARAFKEGIRQAEIEYQLAEIEYRLADNEDVLSTLIPGVSEDEIAEINSLFQEQTQLIAEKTSLMTELSSL